MPQLLQGNPLALMTPATAIVESCQPAPSTGISSMSFSLGDYSATVRLSTVAGTKMYSMETLPQRPAVLREIAELGRPAIADDESQPNDAALIRASRFAAKALRANLPSAVVMRLPEGGVLLRYRAAGVFVSVEAFNDGDFIVALSGAAVATQIEIPADDDAALALVVRHLH